jgi:adenylate kinase
VDDDALITRIVHRYTCGDCGAVYNDKLNPTKVDGMCDKCGGTNMKRRADDNEESLRTRLLNYYKDTSPLIGYYYANDNLTTVDGLGEIGEVKALIAGALDG